MQQVFLMYFCKKNQLPSYGPILWSQIILEFVAEIFIIYCWFWALALSCLHRKNKSCKGAFWGPSGVAQWSSWRHSESKNVGSYPCRVLRVMNLRLHFAMLLFLHMVQFALLVRWKKTKQFFFGIKRTELQDAVIITLVLASLHQLLIFLFLSSCYNSINVDPKLNLISLSALVFMYSTYLYIYTYLRIV
jgi:hypothetical protein